MGFVKSRTTFRRCTEPLCLRDTNSLGKSSTVLLQRGSVRRGTPDLDFGYPSWILKEVGVSDKRVTIGGWRDDVGGGSCR